MHIIPESVPILHPVENIHSLGKPLVIDIIGRGLHLGIVGVSPVAAVGGISVAAVAAARRCASGGSVFLFIHDLLVGLLNLFEFFLRLSFIGVVDIGVRMIFPAQCPVCFFYFLSAGISGNTQHFIWILH